MHGVVCKLKGRQFGQQGGLNVVDGIVGDMCSNVVHIGSSGAMPGLYVGRIRSCEVGLQVILCVKGWGLGLPFNEGLGVWAR